jgi:hypothetical protein
MLGQVRELESKRGIPSLRVSASDKDLILGGLLAEVATDANGNFQLSYEGQAFQRLFDSRPDVYRRIETADGKALYTTEHNLRCEAGTGGG